jgi:hypothetical protein
MTIEQFIKMLSKENPKDRIFYTHWNKARGFAVDRVPTHLIKGMDGHLRIVGMPRFKDQ